MTSTVTNYTKTFDETYPKAGADNNSQQFRDNFAAIKSAFTATSNELSDLQNKVVLKSALNGSTLTNDFSYNSISNVNLVNQSYTVKNWVDTGITDVNYAQGQYQSLMLPAGATSLNITGVPSATADDEPRMGSMIVVVSTSTADATSVSFTSDVSDIEVVNLGPTAQPFSLSDNIPLMFEIWATSADAAEPTITPKLYVKKLTEYIKPDVYTNASISSYAYSGNNATFLTTVRAGTSVSIGNNTYTTGTTTGTVGATVVTNGTNYNNLALVPNQIVVKLTAKDIAPPGGITDHFDVVNGSKVYAGAKLYFKGTYTSYTVASVNSNTVYVSPSFNVTYCDVGDDVTFNNLPFSNQPTVATFTTSTSTQNIVGSIYANTTSFQVIFEDKNSTATNTFNISNILVNSITAGSGTSITTSTGNVVLTNTGVLSVIQSTNTAGIYVSTSTGYIEIAIANNSNGFGTRYVQSSEPSTPKNGDVWYKTNS